MSRVTDRNAQLIRWLNKMFPPSAPQPTQPREFDEVLRLTVPALPPSLLFERMFALQGFSAAGGTQLYCPGSLNADGSPNYTPADTTPNTLSVPLGKFLWVFAARLEDATALPTAAGRAFIGVKPVGAVFECAVGTGFFTTTSFDFADSHAIPMNGAGGTSNGGGTGPFIVPPGYNIHYSFAGTPAAGTVMKGTIIAVECTIGELIPGSV